MKAKLLFLFIFLLLLVTLVSCDTSDAGETTPATEVHVHVTPTFRSMREYHEYIDQKYVDRAVSHKPTREDAMKVTEGMTVAEVIALIGKPHYESGSGLYYLEWYLADGDYFFAWIAWPGAPTPNPPHALAYLQYGVVGAAGIESP